MTDYIIEGGFDFYDELYKNQDLEKEEKEEDLCLISNQPLTKYYYTMVCGHKFNYDPLFKDINSHKNKFNELEGKTGKLKENEIRCPYCRTKQQVLLPFYEELSFPKIHGVNWFDTTIHNSSTIYIYKQCCFISQYQDDDNIIQDIICSHMGSKINPNTGYLDDNYYCYHHKKIMINIHKKIIHAFIKKEKKESKLQIKYDIKKEKDLLKKEQKLNGYGCIEIIKSGINKGHKCICKLFNETMCKRHYNLKNKST